MPRVNPGWRARGADSASRTAFRAGPGQVQRDAKASRVSQDGPEQTGFCPGARGWEDGAFSGGRGRGPGWTGRMGRLLVGGRRGGVHPSALVSAQTQGPLLLIRDLRWGELAQSVAIFSERGNISPGVRKREGTGWQEGGDWLVSLSREEPQAEGRACLWEVIDFRLIRPMDA